VPIDQQNQTLVIADNKITSLCTSGERATVDLDQIQRLELRTLEVARPRGYNARNQLEFIGKDGVVRAKFPTTWPVCAGYLEVLRVAKSHGVAVPPELFDATP
jgi:hypothetical protein